jgi:hypothetical protein
LPLLTFPGTGIYDYAKEHRYFADDEEYWDKYGGDFRVRYTDYSDEAANAVISIANTMYRWKYHQSMADDLLKSLQRQSSSFFDLNYSIRYSIVRFLKSYPRVTKLLSPLLGSRRLHAIDHMKRGLPHQKHPRADKKLVHEFADRCIAELVRPGQENLTM